MLALEKLIICAVWGYENPCFFLVKIQNCVCKKRAEQR